MARAIWNGVIIAESDAIQVVDGYTYFPRTSLKWEHFEPSEHSSRCSWKGTANYYSLNVQGERNPDAAWEYATPSAAAAQIKDHIGFWRGVRIER
ncbi:MAG: DUF427 domain-containing protein [Gemmatimonadota bacterium]